MLTYTPQAEARRAEVRQWLKDNLPERWFDKSYEMTAAERKAFNDSWPDKLFAGGWICATWPKEYGGQGVAGAFQKVADQEMARHDVPICFNTIGLNWVGPMILDIGSDAERAKYLKGILSGEDIWCQGFSEPDHGSDLGNAQTRAVRDGDDYVVNGSKIWTTLGNFAKYMILLARTTPNTERKYDGLSFFLAPMQIPGVDAHPIRKITGEYGFNQMFFTDARIPADCMMGEEGDGWRIAMKTLEYERGVSAGQAGGLWMIRVLADDAITQLQGHTRDGDAVLADPMVRDRLVQLAMEEKALQLGQKRAGISALTTDYPFSLPISGKYRATEYTRRLRQLAVALQGSDGALYVGDDDVRDGGFWQRAYFNAFSATIGGGTTQVQANIIGEHVLGLPK